MRELTKKLPFIWVRDHNEAYEAIKKEITHAHTLRYYETNKASPLQEDSCLKGLGAEYVAIEL